MGIKQVTVKEGTEPRLGELPFSEQEYERRLAGVRARMRAQNLDAFLTFTPENMYYINGHDTPGYYWYQACVITHDRPPITVCRLMEVGATLSLGWSRLAVTYADRENPIEATVGLLHELGVAGRTIGMETDAWFISPRQYRRLTEAIQRAGGTLVDTVGGGAAGLQPLEGGAASPSGLIEAMRMTKSPEEIAYQRVAGRIVSAGMATAIAASHEGANENEVAAETIATITRLGGEYGGLPQFVASGPRTGITHATWAGRTYKKGDVLFYEFCGVMKRYCAALYRTGSVGQPSGEVIRRGSVVREALEAVIDAIRPGVTMHDVNQVHRRVFAKYGLEHLHVHRTGYSLGVNYPPDWGEGHIISIYENDHRVFQPGMTFHLGIAMYDLSFAAAGSCVGNSETVTVTENGCEVLTSSPRGMFSV